MEPLRILCFGDSLTEGYTRMGTEFHPYAGSMTASLQKAFPTTQLHVDVEGLSGDKVCPPGLFMPRMEAKCKSNFYDWVILLGGTNDLGWGEQPDKVFTGLQNVEQLPLLNRANILIMTVPETSLVKKDLDDRRHALNAAIKEQCDDTRIFLFDLHTKIPYHALPPTERDKLWDDGVHFTANGYDIMGEYIAERLVQVIPLARLKKLEQSQERVGNPMRRDEKEDCNVPVEKTNPPPVAEKEPKLPPEQSQKQDVFHSEIKQETPADDNGVTKWSCGMCVIQ